MSDDAEHVHTEEPKIADPMHGTWIRARVAAEVFLGHVYQLDFEDPYLLKDVLHPDGTRTDEKKQACSARAILEAKVITLFPTYQFTVREMRVPIPGPDGKPMKDPETGLPATGISREPSITGVDFNLHPVMMHIKTDETAIYVFSQQHKNDQATLREFCRHAEERCKQHREQALAQSTGLATSATPEQVRAEAERQRRVRRG